MKKSVNGKVIDITNIELFKAAFEGIALNSLASSSIADTLDDKPQEVKECVDCYYKMYRALPFPLYAIENEVKYASIGMFIRDSIKRPLTMWVDGALYIMIDDKKALKLLSNTWAIVSVQSINDDNVEIEEFRYEVGYREFKWALTKLMNMESLAGFYNEFMPNFIEACNKEPMVIKWELGRILEFGYVPEVVKLKDNKIVDYENNVEYFLDIFSTGRKKTEEKYMQLVISSGSGSMTTRSKYSKVYDFNVYSKRICDSDKESKLTKVEYDGFAGVFEKIIGKGIGDNGESDKYTGLISMGDIAFQVGKSVYICRLDSYHKPKELGRNIELIGFEKNRVYVEKRVRQLSGVFEKSIYAYDILTDRLKICKISYE